MIWVIIPTYNEERALPQTLGALFQQIGDYRILVVDGGSHDRTEEIVRKHGQITWISAPKGRASQMNAGALSGPERKILPKTTGWSFSMPTPSFPQMRSNNSMI